MDRRSAPIPDTLCPSHQHLIDQSDEANNQHPCSTPNYRLHRVILFNVSIDYIVPLTSPKLGTAAKKVMTFSEAFVRALLHDPILVAYFTGTVKR